MKKYEDIKIREDLIIRITKIQKVNSNRILARVDIVITNIRIVQGNNNLFVSMPQKKSLTGEYYNIVYFLEEKIKKEIDNIILDKYFEERRNKSYE